MIPRQSFAFLLFSWGSNLYVDFLSIQTMVEQFFLSFFIIILTYDMCQFAPVTQRTVATKMFATVDNSEKMPLIIPCHVVFV